MTFFFASGSCFARNIEQALLNRRIKILSRTPDSGFLPAFFNRYNTFSILDDFRSALKSWNVESRLVFVRDHWVDYTGFSRDKSKEKVIQQRETVFRTYERVRDSTVIAITLGMAEVWFDRLQGRYLNVTPTEHLLEEPDRYELRVTSFEENYNALVEIDNLLRKELGLDVRILITVSPVPFLTTFSGEDVIVANMYSKAVLRAVASAFSESRDYVDYFPSYEMATLSDPNIVWIDDRRHVRQDFVNKIMDTFLRSYGGDSIVEAIGRDAALPAQSSP